MADTISPERRSQNMSHIRAKDTAVEIKTRKYLFSQGFRYRKNDKSYPGKPDIVLSKYKTVVFIHGCFWHQHKGCKAARIPGSRQEYWIPKLQKNVERDKKHIEDLETAGWKVIVIWECGIKKDFQGTMDKTIAEIRGTEPLQTFDGSL